MAADHLIKHNTKAEYVAASVERFAFHLLRRHVGNCAQYHSRFGEQALGLCLTFSERLLPGCLCQPEVHQLRLPAPGDHYVLGLDVSMNDSARVSLGKPISNLHCYI